MIDEQIKRGMENALRANPQDVREQYERQLKDLQEAYGEARVNETHVTFLDLETMLATLSPRRLELLRFVRQHGAKNVRELATSIQRDYKNVHQDVAALQTAGLLLREGRKLSAPWDELQASVALA